jgi:hypothetical protein
MPITYQIDDERGVVLTVASGILTTGELIAHKEQLMNDPRFKSGIVELSDVRAIEKINVNGGDVRQFAEIDRTYEDRLKNYKLAIVASGDLVFGLARMYEMQTESHNPGVMVFRDVEKAKTWLGRWEKQLAPAPQP